MAANAGRNANERRRDPMVAREEHGSTLSTHRAFVVHLGTGGGPGRRRFSGQVEHLSSGESMRFTSLKRLLAFFAAVLDAADGAAFPDPGSVLPRLDAAQPSRQPSLSALHPHQTEDRS